MLVRLHVCEAKILPRRTLGICRRYVYTGHSSEYHPGASYKRENLLRGMLTPDKSKCTQGQTVPIVPSAKEKPSSPSSSPLILDPPFTPVPGESQVMNERDSSTGCGPLVLVYVCSTCKSPLFCSSEYSASSTLGQHSSGWPSFTAPVCTTVLHLRSIFQRNAVQHSGEGGSGTAVSLKATLAYRGLRVEGEMVRQTRSGHCGPLQPRTWREECLRDENKRSDPTVLEGCCAVCGKAVCRVVTGRRRGMKYVVNPSAVKAERTECNHPDTTT